MESIKMIIATEVKTIGDYSISKYKYSDYYKDCEGIDHNKTIFEVYRDSDSTLLDAFDRFEDAIAFLDEYIDRLQKESKKD